MSRREFNSVSNAEIEARKKMYEKADSLGIDLLRFDGEEVGSDKAYKHDVNQAILLLVSGKEVPEELERRLKEKRKPVLA